MIGILDFSTGGLLALREILRNFPKADFVFLADNSQLDFEKQDPQQLVANFQRAAACLFEKHKVDTLLLPNLAGSLCAGKALAAKFPQKKILPLHTAALQFIAENAKFHQCGICTGGHALSPESLANAWQGGKLNWHFANCEILTALAGSLWLDKPETKMILKKKILPLKHAHVNCLLLAHQSLSLFTKQFARKMGRNCSVLPLERFALQALKMQNIKVTQNGQRTFLATCPSADLDFRATKIFREKVSFAKIAL